MVKKKTTNAPQVYEQKKKNKRCTIYGRNELSEKSFYRFHFENFRMKNTLRTRVPITERIAKAPSEIDARIAAILSRN